MASHYFNREIGWLKFNRRVLHLAEDSRTPLLERVRFLNIYHSNLDEFFMKRVGGLQRQMFAKVGAVSPDGLTAEDQLTMIRNKVIRHSVAIQALLDEKLLPLLTQENIHLLMWSDLTIDEQKWAADFFRQKVFPVLTPMAVDLGHPFPLISNLSTSLAISLKSPNDGELLFARIKIPQVFPMWVEIPNVESKSSRFVSLIEIVKHHVHLLFPKMEIDKVMSFRVTRNIDVEAADEEGVEDLLELIEEEVKQRKFAEVVRLEHDSQADEWLLKFLLEELDLQTADVYQFPKPLEYRDLQAIPVLPKLQLKYKPWTGVTIHPLGEEGANIFTILGQNDLLVHHPYESFATSVERFIVDAADDPQVVAIKKTLYRTSDNSSIVHALIRAAEKGKQVVCLIELKARFDEERNIHWAQTMERAGVHVVYGIVGLKTHAKITLVVRREKDEFRSFAHIGTGNYHPLTARLYTDLGYFTSKPEIVSEVVEVFHYLTGRSLKSDYNRLLVAPINLKGAFLSLIQTEIVHASQGRPSRIIAKFNNLEDRDIIDALYQASQGGVKVDLIIRGFCCLKPQIPGLSDNIRVVSVVGQFLEHSRIFYFNQGATDPLDGLFYIGSADWMSRNLIGRVEVAAPIQDRPLKEKLFEILSLMLADHSQTWDMDAEGDYQLRQPRNPEEELGCQELLMEKARLRALLLKP
jgi:polyphosphate kinase